MSKSVFRSQFIQISAHLCAWFVFLLMPLFLRQSDRAMAEPPKIKNLPFEGVLFLSVMLMMVFYSNYLFLVPRVLNQRGLRLFLLANMGLWLCFGLGIHALKCVYLNSEANFPTVLATFPFLLFATLSISIRLLVDRSKQEQDLKERENESLKSELSFLRSQISPHFLFNVMNNVVALSRVKPHLVEPTMIKLSGLMRYMLYESDEKKVSIESEAAYLESYIDLQKLRFGDAVAVNFDHDTEGGQMHQIEPMLLIPFVENAFKHGVGLIENPEINIELKIESNQLIFNVFNKFDPLSKEEKDSDSGIGLKNVSRRLELLYGQNQKLDLNTEGGIFRVNLTIQLCES